MNEEISSKMESKDLFSMLFPVKAHAWTMQDDNSYMFPRTKDETRGPGNWYFREIIPYPIDFDAFKRKITDKISCLIEYIRYRETENSGTEIVNAYYGLRIKATEDDYDYYILPRSLTNKEKKSIIHSISPE